MSGRVGKADRSRGPLMAPGMEFDERPWVAVAAKMRRRGMSYQAIANELHKPYRRVYVALNRDRVREWDAKSPSASRKVWAERKREERLRKAVPCVQCGRPMNKPEVKGRVCRRCLMAQTTDTTGFIVEAWNRGVPATVICEIIGISRTAMDKRLSCARQQGQQVISGHERYKLRYTSVIVGDDPEPKET